MYTLHTGRDSDREPLLTPATKLGQGNISSSMCQEFCSQGEYLGRYPPPQAGTPPGRYTPAREQRMLGDTGNKRAVRIRLECILVFYCAHPGPCPGPSPVQCQ